MSALQVAKNQWLLSSDNNGAIVMTRPAGGNALVHPPMAANAPRVHFKVEGKKGALEFKGPDGSPITAMALGIAERMVT